MTLSKLSLHDLSKLSLHQLCKLILHHLLKQIYFILKAFLSFWVETNVFRGVTRNSRIVSTIR